MLDKSRNSTNWMNNIPSEQIMTNRTETIIKNYDSGKLRRKS